MSASPRFADRPLEGAYPYRWLDAKHVKVRDHGRVVSKALVVAYLEQAGRVWGQPPGA
jgi:transposase-like protein